MPADEWDRSGVCDQQEQQGLCTGKGAGHRERSYSPMSRAEAAGIGVCVSWTELGLLLEQAEIPGRGHSLVGPPHPSPLTWDLSLPGLQPQGGHITDRNVLMWEMSFWFPCDLHFLVSCQLIFPSCGKYKS